MNPYKSPAPVDNEEESTLYRILAGIDSILESLTIPIATLIFIFAWPLVIAILIYCKIADFIYDKLHLNGSLKLFAIFMTGLIAAVLFGAACSTVWLMGLVYAVNFLLDVTKLYLKL